jgi:hypothetical protein
VKQLISRTESEFYIQDNPVILKFNEDGKRITLTGSQLTQHWTTNGLVYVKKHNEDGDYEQ